MNRQRRCVEREHLVRTGWGLLILVILVGIYLLLINPGWAYHWSWTGFGPEIGPDVKSVTYSRVSIVEPSKYLWDWLQLLIVPLLLAVGGYLLNRAVAKREAARTEDYQREAALEAYLDRVPPLLVRKRRAEQPRRAGQEQMLEIMTLAQARTVTTIRRLDGRRNGLLLQFLRASELLKRNSTDIDLTMNDLRGVDLRGADLSGVDLTGADLRGADLRGARFRDAYLDGADLRGAKFIEVQLKKAKSYGGIILKGDPNEE